MTGFSLAQRSLVTASTWRAWEVLLWLAAFAAPMVLSGHAAGISEIAIFALFAVSLDLILGFTGIVSLGHAAFFGLSAYGTALFAKHVHPDPLLGLAVGMATAMLLGFITSFTVHRGTDLTRVMVTLGTALMLMELANKLDWLTGGSDGLQGVVMGPIVGRFEFDLDGRTAAYYSLTVLLVCFLVVRRVMHSAFGISLKAIRDNRLRATAIGIRLYPCGGPGRCRRRASGANHRICLSRCVRVSSFGGRTPDAGGRRCGMAVRGSHRCHCLQGASLHPRRSNGPVLDVLARLVPCRPGLGRARPAAALDDLDPQRWPKGHEASIRPFRPRCRER